MTASDPDPYFFLSFAGENNRDDDRVARFFTDLCDDVGVEVGAGRATQRSVGFLSITSLRLGAGWSDEIAEALGRCRVFVALCSPSYFRSPSCGVEWRAFQDRLALYQEEHKKPAPALLPVCWVPMTMPSVVAGIQHTDRHLSEPLARLGLRKLMLLKQHRDDYRDAVLQLAQRIVHVSLDHVVPHTVVDRDYSRLPRAFPVPPPQRNPRPPDRHDKKDDGLPELDHGDTFPRLHGI